VVWLYSVVLDGAFVVFDSTHVAQPARQLERDPPPEPGMPIGERRKVWFRNPRYHRICRRDD
jgi:hypothetical protein